MLARFRECLALALIAFLPFHALMVTVLTKLIAGPGHAPLGAIAVWKEGVLALILILAIGELGRLGTREIGRKLCVWDLIDRLILALILLGGVVSVWSGLVQQSPGLVALGFKYDFVPLVSFLILRRVPWSEAFKANVIKVILWVGGIVALYGIISFFLPMSFFTALGYSDLHSLYLPGAPLAAFQQIGGDALTRVQSTFSGPNQFGIWLLLPWSAGISILMRKSVSEPALSGVEGFVRLFVCSYLVLIAIAIGLSFSRSAWIAAVIVGCIAVALSVSRSVSLRIFVSLGVLAVIVCSFGVLLFPQVAIRLESSMGHIERPLAGIHAMIAHPFGQGLGTAGPASNRVSDTCVSLKPGDDASWAKDRPDLCVFLGDVQVQPDRPCRCPFLTENWYLQMGVEMGVVGFLLFGWLVLLVGWLLVAGYRTSVLHATVALAFVGIGIAALFLHAWEDSAVAYTVWMLAAVVLLSDPQSSSSWRSVKR